jgi:NAD(P)-dependent dehydrogenase (short-subunit alcohol dehydrogenase family)
MFGRDEARLVALQSRLLQEIPQSRIEHEAVDLSSKQGIAQAAQRWQRGPLHALVNNAAASPPRRTETSAGLEVQLATNVLGYFWMTNSFLPHLQAAAASSAAGATFGARVVDVASYYAGDLDLDDLQFRRRNYSNSAAYRQSKACNRMLAASLAERLRPMGVSVNSCHPGDVESKLSGDLGFGGTGSQTPEQGADTPAWLAYEPTLSGKTGGYYNLRKEQECDFAKDRAAIEKLYAICSAM